MSSPVTRRSFSTLTIALAFGGMASATVAMAQGQAKVAMLLPGSINDQSHNANGYAAIMKLKANGAETAYSENVPPADHLETMKDYARRGFNWSSATLVASCRQHSVSVRSSRRPRSLSVPVRRASARTSPRSTTTMRRSILMGVLAARLSKTGKIGRSTPSRGC